MDIYKINVRVRKILKKYVNDPACGQIPEKTPAAISLSTATMCSALMLGVEFNPLSLETGPDNGLLNNKTARIRIRVVHITIIVLTVIIAFIKVKYKLKTTNRN